MFLTTPMIDAAAVDATAKGILSGENLIDEGLVCDLDSEADRRGIFRGSCCLLDCLLGLASFLAL
jgi:hypothetical protein